MEVDDCRECEPDGLWKCICTSVSTAMAHLASSSPIQNDYFSVRTAVLKWGTKKDAAVWEKQ
jgi:hypothetical protein